MSAHKQKDIDKQVATGGQVADFAAEAPPEEVARYVAEMLLGLRNMAKDKQMDFLAYLLEMAYQEAFDLSQQQGKGRK